ncbi:MAG: Holliday junction resolvase RuvX [Candidatus Microsaccharimonas sossegonensis]|uniref:Putative pre-16S rRNA nuclease n=1 Tax=Candidatus Microsaccharimonas sossegonensis TaxID=2506948 RepID=A0A4Q0AGH9_9BACT|nr:MAG: Holliday junction resolvase RuvX [Candidatus Microsaccharimonas sossegonensis]
MASQTLVCLDVGEKRIGVAVADTSVRIAVAFDTIAVDGNELSKIAEIMIREGAKTIIVGYPRNQLGETTAQTCYVEQFADKLKNIAEEIVFQDESLTSVIAENRLKNTKNPYTKGDIDAQAAAIILEDYMETK